MEENEGNDNLPRDPQQQQQQQQQQQRAAVIAAFNDERMLSSLRERINVRMIISEEEGRHALAIKAAIQADSTIEPLSDFMLAQVALLDGNDLGQAMKRIRHLQIFRHEYKIKNDFNQAKEVSHRFLKTYPGHMLSIAYDTNVGNYVVVYDQARLDANKLKSDQDWELFFNYGWYLYHALCPDIHAIRQGVTIIAECEGLDWKFCDIGTIQRIWSEMLVMFPVQFRELKFFHSGVFANLTAALMKKFTPERIHGKINLGCQFDGRLNTYYRIPTDEAADSRLQAELETYLMLRFENERTFRLE